MAMEEWEPPSSLWTPMGLGLPSRLRVRPFARPCLTLGQFPGFVFFLFVNRWLQHSSPHIPEWNCLQDIACYRFHQAGPWAMKASCIRAPAFL